MSAQPMSEAQVGASMRRDYYNQMNAKLAHDSALFVPSHKVDSYGEMIAAEMLLAQAQVLVPRLKDNLQGFDGVPR